MTALINVLAVKRKLNQVLYPQGNIIVDVVGVFFVLSVPKMNVFCHPLVFMNPFAFVKSVLNESKRSAVVKVSYPS